MNRKGYDGISGQHQGWFVQKWNELKALRLAKKAADKERAGWMVEHQLSEAPPNGQASFWGTPYSEKPIQFDDVRIEGK